MNKRAVALALLLAATTVPVALAAPPPGKGKPGTTTGTTTTTATKGKKPPKTGAGCRPLVSVILKGTLAADGAAAPSTLSVNVTGANNVGKAYKAATQPTPVAVDAKTKVNRRGKHDPALLKSTDRVVVTARMCKADLAGGATPALTATRVVANPAKSSSTDTNTTTTTG